MPKYLVVWYGSFCEEVEANSEEEAEALTSDTTFDWNTWYISDWTIRRLDEEDNA